MRWNLNHNQTNIKTGKNKLASLEDALALNYCSLTDWQGKGSASKKDCKVLRPRQHTQLILLILISPPFLHLRPIVTTKIILVANHLHNSIHLHFQLQRESWATHYKLCVTKRAEKHGLIK